MRSKQNQILDQLYGFDPTPPTIDYPPKLNTIVIKKCLVCGLLNCDCQLDKLAEEL